MNGFLINKCKLSEELLGPKSNPCSFEVNVRKILMQDKK